MWMSESSLGVRLGAAARRPAKQDATRSQHRFRALTVSARPEKLDNAHNVVVPLELWKTMGLGGDKPATSRDPAQAKHEHSITDTFNNSIQESGVRSQDPICALLVKLSQHARKVPNNNRIEAKGEGGKGFYTRMHTYLHSPRTHPTERINLYVPATFATLDLSGKFTPVRAIINTTLGDSMDPILEGQGVGWIKPKAINAMKMTLSMKHFKDSNGVECIDIAQVVRGSSTEMGEVRVLDWQEIPTEGSFGPVVPRSKCGIS
ncbi:hypothetical protein C8R43DRAFT_1191838 [Mycena crocata]|nr:hypothetical protein C8R43DRAFT_1191838 [Mycena crocata]